MHHEREHEDDAGEGGDGCRGTPADEPETEGHERQKRYEQPVMNTARSAPGDPRLTEGAPRPERMAWPRKNEMKLSSSQKTTAADAVTAILAASRSGRFEVAASVARIVPLEYSGVMSKAPNTPPVRPRAIMPVNAGWVASKPEQRAMDMALWVTSPVTNNAATMVTPSVIAVEQGQDLRGFGLGHMLEAVVPPRDGLDDLSHLDHSFRPTADRIGHGGGAVLHLVLGQFHEGVLQRRGDRCQFVHSQAFAGGQVADLRAVSPSTVSELPSPSPISAPAAVSADVNAARSG